MVSITRRIFKKLSSARAGVTLLALCGVVTATVAVAPQHFSVTPQQHGGQGSSLGKITVSQPDIDITSTLSQTRFVQGADGKVYLSFAIDTKPTDGSGGERSPVDMVVVLDRSGSMSEAKKLPLAKSAIQDLVTRLNADDRFALISFDDSVIVHQPLTAITPEVRSSLNKIIGDLQPGGSTNMGDGLLKAKEILQSNPSIRARKVLLLSDGEANVGIADPTGLGQVAAGLSREAAVLSTIGLGLSFNESTMSLMADYGMGHYAYLENLERLNQIFAQDLDDTRKLFASASEIEIELAPGVDLIDAGGYPFERSALGGRTVKISSGQLINGAGKHFTLSLSAPTHSLGEYSLGHAAFNYIVDGVRRRVELPQSKLVMAVLAPERRQEALASIDSDVYRDTWVQNNYGIMQRQAHAWLKAGDKDKALESIANYRKDLSSAQNASGVRLLDAPTDAKLDQFKREIDDAFTGSVNEQSRKKNVLEKKAWSQSITAQR